MNKKEQINKIKRGQLWQAKSAGLAKGKIVKIVGKARQGYWQTTRVDTNVRLKRIPTHLIRQYDLLKYYEQI